MIAVLQRSSHCLLLDVKLTLRCHRVEGRKKCMCKREFKRNSHTWSADRVGRTVTNTALWAPMSHYFHWEEWDRRSQRSQCQISVLNSVSITVFIWWVICYVSSGFDCKNLQHPARCIHSHICCIKISPPKSLNVSKVGDHFWWPEMLLQL